MPIRLVADVPCVRLIGGTHLELHGVPSLDLGDLTDVVGHAEDLGPVVHETLLERCAIAVVDVNGYQVAIGEETAKDGREDHAVDAARQRDYEWTCVEGVAFESCGDDWYVKEGDVKPPNRCGGVLEDVGVEGVIPVYWFVDCWGGVFDQIGLIHRHALVGGFEEALEAR